MSSLYRMPSLGSDMESATLIEWCKQPGERLAKGDVIAVVETQKGAIEIEVFHDAVMGKPLIAVGEQVPVGAPMAELDEVGDRVEHEPPGRIEALRPCGDSASLRRPDVWPRYGGSASSPSKAADPKAQSRWTTSSRPPKRQPKRRVSRPRPRGKDWTQGWIGPPCVRPSPPR